jgi:hypothetical protein
VARRCFPLRVIEDVRDHYDVRFDLVTHETKSDCFVKRVESAFGGAEDLHIRIRGTQPSFKLRRKAFAPPHAGALGIGVAKDKDAQSAPGPWLAVLAAKRVSRPEVIRPQIGQGGVERKRVTERKGPGAGLDGEKEPGNGD